MADTPIRAKYSPRQPVQIGERFGRLLVIGEAGFRSKKDGSGRIRIVKVRCDCGTEKEMVPSPLRPGIVVSCGCYKIEVATKLVQARSVTHGDCRVGNRAAEYGVYRTMISRCYNPNVERYPRYGGRGIRVCDRWLGPDGYTNFLADMGRREPGTSIEREDASGNYEPKNCRWAGAIEQASNRSNNRIISFRGEDLTLAEWARRTGISALTLHHRMKAGWSSEDTMTRPKRGAR
jgi:hypothetical protein